MSDLTDRMASDVSGIFLGASDFATEATFTFGDASSVINVLFEENYSGHDMFGNEVANSGPVAFCATSDVEDENGNAPGEDDENDAALVIDGTTYNVKKCAREGASCILTLSKD